MVPTGARPGPRRLSKLVPPPPPPPLSTIVIVSQDYLSGASQGAAGREVGGTLLLHFDIKPELFGATSINLTEIQNL